MTDRLPPSMNAVAAAVLAVLASITMFLAFLASLGALIFHAGLPPCAQESELYLWSQFLVPIACLASTVWLGVLARRPNGLRFLFALTLPVAALLVSWELSGVNADAQRRCKAQTLAQAMASCRANPAVYRPGHDTHGNPTLTLVAPGTTDQAYSCLWRWSLHNDSVSLIIDESVYRPRAEPPTSPPPPR